MADVTDPRAVATVWKTFGRGTPNPQLVALDLLGQIDSANATQAMGLLALRTRSAEVRGKVIEKLRDRDFRDVASFLVGLLRDPIIGPTIDPNPILYRFQILPIGAAEYGAPGVLFIKGPRYSVVRSYTVDETYGERSVGQLIADSSSYFDRVQIQRQQQLLDLRVLIDQILGESQVNLALVGEHDRQVNRVNARIIQTLSEATKLDLGKDPEAWRKWWVEERGYAYESPTPKPTLDLTVFADTPTYNLGEFHYSCFAAGTPVHTITGQRPIESIAIGDQVLTQDPQTGALSYQPVLAAVHNKPDAVWKIKLGRDDPGDGHSSLLEGRSRLGDGSKPQARRPPSCSGRRRAGEKCRIRQRPAGLQPRGHAGRKLLRRQNGHAGSRQQCRAPGVEAI